MRFLPIVDRELREGARRHGTYWLRVRVAFQALLVGCGGWVVNLLIPRFKLGTVLFWGLSGISLLFCLLAGRRSTADCLSQEKRNGTLGLLFLTDLKGYDVVLGKMAATSIAGFYALVGIFPVLAIPLMAGGMTNGELWRMVLVLLNTFFLSLAIGVFGSALSREYRTAIAMNFVLSLLVVCAPAACGMGFLSAPGHRFVPWLFYSCPVFSFVSCDDVYYRGLARDFWWSLAVTNALAWTLTLLACWMVRRTWGDKPPPAPSRRGRWRQLVAMMSFVSPVKEAAFRKKALDANAYYWLAGRARLKPAQVWVFVGLAAAWWVYEWLKHGSYMMTEETCIATGLIINCALKLWIATEAGQRLGEDRRSGAFELLLATPLRVGDFLRGQILALRRQFFKPLLVVTALEVILVLTVIRRGSSGTQDMLAYFASIGMLWADMAALAWVAMAAALLCKTQTQVAAFTVARIIILPWAACMFVLGGIEILNLADLIRWHPSDPLGQDLWFGAGLAADLFFGLRARHILRKNFRQLAVQSFLAEPPRSPWWNFLGTAAKWTGQLAARSVPARARKPVLACLAVGAALAAVVFVRSNQVRYPPPVVISIIQSNAPFRVFPGGGSGVFFVMPDGTLWRWGRSGAPQSPRAAAPEQVGQGRDWVKVVGAGTHCLGLRADGTIWGWGFSNGGFWPEPQPAMDGHDWIDLATGHHHAAAIKRDGTLWIWNEPLVAHDSRRTPKRRFVSSNNVAVYCGPDTTLALKRDGTIWAEGDMSGFNRRVPASLRFIMPAQLCAETNWTTLEANGMAQNRAGEWWDVANALPNPPAGAASVCVLAGSSLAPHRVSSLSTGMQTQICADGTLWTKNVAPNSQHEPSRQLGARSDWVAVWGIEGTGFGMTADGIVWTWGLELDKEPVKTYESRLELLRDRLAGRAVPAANKKSSSYSAQPRPLLKLVGGKEDQRHR